jgi:hypothetical protein
MNLRAATRELIKQVEESTGRPVLVQSDASLKVLATVRMARGSAPAHLVTYNPTGGDASDYLIAFQCGFIIRLFASPAPERFDFAGSKTGRSQTLEAVSAQPEIKKLNLPISAVREYAGRIFDGLMTQLRSVPIGLRVDSWLATDFPELHELQRTFGFRQLQENQQILSAEVRRLAVSPIYEASTAMNAAFAAYWARTLDQPSLVLPYKATGIRRGEDLLATWDAIHPHPVHDREVIESWGQTLGLAGWYEWVPYALDGEAAS